MSEMDLSESINAMRNIGVALNDYDSEALETVIQAAEKLIDFAIFVKSIQEDYDCDRDAHIYGTQCRSCEAKRLLQK